MPPPRAAVPSALVVPEHKARELRNVMLVVGAEVDAMLAGAGRVAAGVLDAFRTAFERDLEERRAAVAERRVLSRSLTRIASEQRSLRGRVLVLDAARSGEEAEEARLRARLAAARARADGAQQAGRFVRSLAGLLDKL